LIIPLMLSEVNKLWSSLFCSFIQPPVTSFLFDPNILLWTKFTNTFSLCSFPSVIRDKVSHQYRTTG
jgi:hypothetical protein